MKVWAKTKQVSEGKFLVIRRDGSVPQWPHFVLGARDPAAPDALRAYSQRCAELRMDPEYVSSLIELADDFDDYRARQGNGDPDGAPHRIDDDDVIRIMRGGDGSIIVWHSKDEPKRVVSVTTKPTFEEAWKEMERKGYHYGKDALEQVRMGWEMAYGRG